MLAIASAEIEKTSERKMAMTKNMVVVGQEPTLGQIRDFARQCADGTLNRQKVQAILNNEVVYPWESGATIVSNGVELITALSLAEHQAHHLFGYKADIAKMFALPEVLPWKKIIAILLPSGLDNRQAVNSLRKYGLAKWEETDVNKYSGSKASGKTQLFLMERSVRPTKNTMGNSPDTLVKTDRLWLPLKAYALAFGQYYESTHKYLDAETCTWFPTERLSGGGVAYGYWYPDDRYVRFLWDYADCEDDGMGAREAIEVPLKVV